ncbi:MULTISPECIES: Pycsar system effector family protein [unclassified Streptomyces]|uniref:Pycsar system effector family protein n=1 Tax=unclassified Streptomyces TaxID=2593676 RepID=UPI0004C09FF2|nr:MULTISPECIES: Pycsar system effector family protein [unclassified Streptomyces]
MAQTDPVDTAWRIHAALADWTGKVDAKAGFALTLESAVLGAVIAVSGSRHRPELDGTLPVILLWLGAGLLALAALASVSVVGPRLRTPAGHDWREHFVYFGDLRHWAPEHLAEKLADTSPLESLSRQIVSMSRIAWTKHQRVQQSLLLAVTGVAAIALAWLLG